MLTNHGLFSLENQSLNIDHPKSGWDENKPIMDQGKEGVSGMAQRRLENVSGGWHESPFQNNLPILFSLKTEN